MNNIGLVSCIIPTYMRVDELKRSIKSVIDQSYSNLEILVIDDNVNPTISENVLNMCKEFNDQRIKYYKMKNHINGAAARNLGLSKSSGEYIAFLDDDDQWDKNKIQKQIDVFNHLSDDYSLVSCLSQFKKEGTVIREARKYKTNNAHYDIFSRNISVYTPTIMVRNEFLKTNNIFFDETLMRHQDIQFLLDITAISKFQLLPEVLVTINIDDALNKPDYDKIIKIKNAFFNSVKSHLEKYSWFKKRRIFGAHRFEEMLVAFREMKIKMIFRSILKIGICPICYMDFLIRITKRKKESV